MNKKITSEGYEFGLKPQPKDRCHDCAHAKAVSGSCMSFYCQLLDMYGADSMASRCSKHEPS